MISEGRRGLWLKHRTGSRACSGTRRRCGCSGGLLRTGEVSQAYLFHGPAGVGKRTVARKVRGRAGRRGRRGGRGQGAQGAASRPDGGRARGGVHDHRSGKGGGAPRGEPALRGRAPGLHPAGRHPERAGGERAPEDARGTRRRDGLRACSRPRARGCCPPSSPAPRRCASTPSGRRGRAVSRTAGARASPSSRRRSGGAAWGSRCATRRTPGFGELREAVFRAGFAFSGGFRASGTRLAGEIVDRAEAVGAAREREVLARFEEPDRRAKDVGQTRRKGCA